MNATIVTLRVPCTVFFAVALTASFTQADWHYDFDDGQTFPIIVNETSGGQPSPTFTSSTEGGILTLQDLVPHADGGAEWTKALDRQEFTDVRVTATVNPQSTTPGGGLAVLARSTTERASSYFAALGSWYSEGENGSLTVAKAFEGLWTIELNSWEVLEGRDPVPFHSPYVLELVVRDLRDEADVEYTQVIGRLLEADGATELMALGFRDYGTDDPRLVPGLSGVAALTEDPHPSDLVLKATFDDVEAVSLSPPLLQAGDADMDLDFDQLDLVQVQIAGKYFTGQPATWGEGDWNGVPGGSVESPPAGDGVFDSIDIIAALASGFYLTGPYAATEPNGPKVFGQASLRYDARTGELAVDAPAGTELTSVNIDSAAGIFTRHAARNLGGSFDNDSDANIFKATFSGSFEAISFGQVAPAGLTEPFVRNDLTVSGSLQGGGHLSDVDLVYVPVPEPAALALFAIGLLAIAAGAQRTRRSGCSARTEPQALASGTGRATSVPLHPTEFGSEVLTQYR